MFEVAFLLSQKMEHKLQLVEKSAFLLCSSSCYFWHLNPRKVSLKNSFQIEQVTFPSDSFFAVSDLSKWKTCQLVTYDSVCLSSSFLKEETNGTRKDERYFSSPPWKKEREREKLLFKLERWKRSKKKELTSWQQKIVEKESFTLSLSSRPSSSPHSNESLLLHTKEKEGGKGRNL